MKPNLPSREPLRCSPSPISVLSGFPGLAEISLAQSTVLYSSRTQFVLKFHMTEVHISYDLGVY